MSVSRLVGERRFSRVEVGCSGRAAAPVWASREREGGEPSAVPPMRKRRPQDGCGSKEESHGVMVAS